MGCIILEMATTATHDANEIASILVQIKHSPQVIISFTIEKFSVFHYCGYSFRTVSTFLLLTSTIEYGIFGEGSQISTYQKLLASDWLKFVTLSCKYRTLFKSDHLK